MNTTGLLILAITIVLLVAASPLMVQRRAEYEASELREAVIQNSDKVDYAQVCPGWRGEDLATIARKNGWCKWYDK